MTQYNILALRASHTKALHHFLDELRVWLKAPVHCTLALVLCAFHAASQLLRSSFDSGA